MGAVLWVLASLKAAVVAVVAALWWFLSQAGDGVWWCLKKVGTWMVAHPLDFLYLTLGALCLAALRPVWRWVLEPSDLSDRRGWSVAWAVAGTLFVVLALVLWMLSGGTTCDSTIWWGGTIVCPG